MISEEFFKPTVILFGLISLLTTFQTMMNEILQDLINTREVISFIDNVIVRIKPRSFYKFTLLSSYYRVYTLCIFSSQLYRLLSPGMNHV